ncbi:hypothetical protein ACH4U6_21065 [Streptomyces netropsis]|uniref:hypothetical protein n=1 Tax=Streptomyces netropsis TaxID=55404 RepID=UPI0037BA868D
MTATVPPRAGGESAYERAVRGVWAALYDTEDTTAVPPEVRNAAGFRLERARRLAAVAAAVTARLPTAGFLYLAGEGTPGIGRFVASDAWRAREREPGEDFPPGPSTARAFAEYLEKGWPEGRPGWQWELASADTDLAYRPPVPSPAARRAGLSPAPATRLRVSPYDTADYARRTALKKQRMPWDLVLDTVRPLERRTAILVPGTGPGAGRPLVLHDEEAAALAWLTEAPREHARVPAGEPGEELLRRLVEVGALVRDGGAG